MNQKLIALQAELDLLREAHTVQYDSFISEFDKLIKKHILDPYGAVCIRRWIRTSYTSHKSVTLNMEIGFYDIGENTINWASDVMISFEEELRINHSCCGYFSKNDPCQFSRARLIAGIGDNMDSIEYDFAQLASRASDILWQNEDDRFELQRQLDHINNEIYLAERNNISDLIEARQGTFTINDSIPQSFGLSSGDFIVTHITPKYVDIQSNATKLRVRKDTLVDYIMKGHITCKTTAS